VETLGAMIALSPDTETQGEDWIPKTIQRELYDWLSLLIRTCPVRVDMVELADGFADLDYVVEGARLEFGIHGQEIADEVQRANMAKVGGPIREDGKRLKPAGWKPPDIAGVLRAQGWKEER
jgi:hypothetical protein